jgi:hypothetical protein
MLPGWLGGVPRVVVTHDTRELPRRDHLTGRLLWRLAWATRPEVIYKSTVRDAAAGRGEELRTRDAIDVSEETIALARTASPDKRRIPPGRRANSSAARRIGRCPLHVPLPQHLEALKCLDRRLAEAHGSSARTVLG